MFLGLFAEAEKLRSLIPFFFKPIGRKPCPSVIVIEKQLAAGVDVNLEWGGREGGGREEWGVEEDENVIGVARLGRK